MLIDTSTSSQSGPGINNNEGVFYTSQIPRNED